MRADSGAKFTLFYLYPEAVVTTIQPPTTGVVIHCETPGGYSNGATLYFRIYSYRTIEGTRFYSATPCQTAVHTVSYASANIQVSWDAVELAEGYRILRSLDGTLYNYYQDVATILLADDNTGWTSGSTVTPSSYTTYLDNTAPIRTLFWDFYVRGLYQIIGVRLHYGYQDDGTEGLQDLKGLSLGIASLGSGWRQGTEILSQGFMTARFVNDTEWTTLSDSAGLYIGNMDVGDYKDIEFRLLIPDPYPINETGDIRHGLIHWRLNFLTGFMEDDPAFPALYGVGAYGSSLYLKRPIQPLSSPTDTDWILCQAQVLTAAEGVELAGIFTFPGIEVEP